MTRRAPGENPPSVSIEFVAWLVSPRLWLWTAAATAWLASLVGVVGWARYDVSPVGTTVEALTVPLSALAVFLSARALAALRCQRYRDAAMRNGDVMLGSDVSLASVVTVASYTLLGLIAAGAAFPVVYTPEGATFYLAAGIAAIATPIGYLLLTYQVHELIGADRYHRGFRVSPALWFFAATLPWVLTAWLLVVDPAALRVPIPDAVPEPPQGSLAETARIDAWGFAYAGVCAPTVLSFAYAIRRQSEAFLRSVFGI